ncbi:MAG: hypothetical protein HY433_03615 [Candidatus Liptonbacteria bacterium]|nr:hypothetical protein [Candidatus Liptonbacteria bacterium]
MEDAGQFSKEPPPVPKDISREFSDMDVFGFIEFLHTQRREPALSIEVDWKNPDNAKRLKAFLESKSTGQKRFAAIRATKEQYNQAFNVFASGVKWIEVK